jgi:hypothetical protein
MGDSSADSFWASMAMLQDSTGVVCLRKALVNVCWQLVLGSVLLTQVGSDLGGST